MKLPPLLKDAAVTQAMLSDAEAICAFRHGDQGDPRRNATRGNPVWPQQTVSQTAAAGAPVDAARPGGTEESAD